MTRLVIFTLLFFLSTPLYAKECSGPVVTIPISRLTYGEPTISMDGTLRISTGDYEGELIDAFTPKGKAFTGLMTTSEVIHDSDDRSRLMKWLFPKELKPPQHFTLITLSTLAQDEIKGLGLVKIHLSYRYRGRVINGAFFVNPEVSYLCSPK